MIYYDFIINEEVTNIQENQHGYAKHPHPFTTPCFKRLSHILEVASID